MAASLLINGDFANGLEGWNKLGTPFDTGAAAVLSDQGGERVAVFQTVAMPANSFGTLVSFDFFGSFSSNVPVGTAPDSLFASFYLGATHFGSDLEAGSFNTAIGLGDIDHNGIAGLPVARGRSRPVCESAC
ncbi:MAG: hypothetical protein ACR2OZ_12405 [Verrucomicrobiales bacterium]